MPYTPESVYLDREQPLLKDIDEEKSYLPEEKTTDADSVSITIPAEEPKSAAARYRYKFFAKPRTPEARRILGVVEINLLQDSR